MKKVIKANTDLKTLGPKFEDTIRDILSSVDYEVTFIGNFPDYRKIQAQCVTDENMPNISFQFDAVSLASNEYHLIPTLIFPQLTVNDDDYTDTIHHQLKKWERVGRAITKLNSFVFIPEEWQE